MDKEEKEIIEETALHTLEELENNEKEDENDVIKKLTEERDKYKEKYEKAVEINNQLFQKITSPIQKDIDPLDDILKNFS